MLLCLQEAACRRKAVLSYFGEKRQACQAQNELPCDVCQDRKLVLSQLSKLEAVQQATAVSEANKQQNSSSPSPVKAAWQRSAATPSNTSGLPSASASPPSCSPPCRKQHVLQPLNQALRQTAEIEEVTNAKYASTECQLPTQPCKRICTMPAAKEQQRLCNKPEAALLPAPATDNAQTCSRVVMKPVIKRPRYNTATAFKPPRKA